MQAQVVRLAVALKHLAGLFEGLHPDAAKWGDYKAALAVLVEAAL